MYLPGCKQILEVLALDTASDIITASVSDRASEIITASVSDGDVHTSCVSKTVPTQNPITSMYTNLAYLIWLTY